MRFFPPTPPPVPEQVKLAWRQFTSHSELDSSVVRPHVMRAWTRCAGYGCSPFQGRADVLSAAGTASLLEQEKQLIQVATPFLNALSTAAGAERHAAMLADAHGRVLKIVGDPLTTNDENFPRPGSLLSEETAGANGIGTTVSEGHYVELVGPEHYIEGFHVFTCQGVPMMETPGLPSAVLSMSMRRVEAAYRIRDILFCASEAAACELLSCRLSSAVVETASRREFLEPLRQDIVQGIAIARLQLELSAHDIATGDDATVSLAEARSLSESFRRQAMLWRDLARTPAGQIEPIELDRLAHDFVILLETQSRVSSTTLSFGQMDPVRVLDDSRALPQRLLEAFLTAMYRASHSNEITVHVFRRQESGVVSLASQDLGSGQPIVHEVHSPLLK